MKDTQEKSQLYSLSCVNQNSKVTSVAEFVACFKSLLYQLFWGMPQYPRKFFWFLGDMVSLSLRNIHVMRLDKVFCNAELASGFLNKNLNYQITKNTERNNSFLLQIFTPHFLGFFFLVELSINN